MPRHRSDNHPISGENIKQAIDKAISNNSDWERSIRTVNQALTDFQDRWEQEDLAELIRERQWEGEWESLAERIETRWGWYLNTYDYILLEILTPNPGVVMERDFDDETGFPDDDGLQWIVWEAHRLQFDEIIERRNLRRITGQTPRRNEGFPIVVLKTYGWIGAENAKNTEIKILLEAGLTPAEALDYLYAEQAWRGSTSDWSETRECSAKEVSRNIERAKRKLRNTFGESPYDKV